MIRVAVGVKQRFGMGKTRLPGEAVSPCGKSAAPLTIQLRVCELKEPIIASLLENGRSQDKRGINFDGNHVMKREVDFNGPFRVLVELRFRSGELAVFVNPVHHGRFVTETTHWEDKASGAASSVMAPPNYSAASRQATTG